MESRRNGIDEPLGLSGPERRWKWSGRGSVLLFGVAAAILVTSTTIALREFAFRDPPAPALAAQDADPVSPAQQERAPAPTPEPRRDSPSIIRVNPEPAGDGALVIRDPSALTRSPLVAHLPDPELIEQTEIGPLPVRDGSGRRPFDAYSRSWSGVRGARISLLIGGLGISQTGTQEAIEKLPSEITLAFAPLGNSLARWMQTARREGHEIMLQVPLEPIDYPRNDPGRHTLLTGASAEENLQSLYWVLSRITNYTGLVNYAGGRFTADEDAMGLLLDELGRRGLAYLDDGSSARSVADRIARTKGVPFAAGDLIIDRDAERGAVLQRLDELERIARARGFAIGSGSALAVTVDTVAQWAHEVRRRGIELVPISAVTDDPEHN